MRKTKTAKQQPLPTQRLDDIPASPVPTELAPNQIAEMKDRHQQFMARVVELSDVLNQDAAAVVRATRFPADLFVQVSSPGTYAGDSGMLWKDSTGRAVAIHGFAEPAAPGEGSTITASMWAARAVAKLQAVLNQRIEILSEPN